MILGPPVLMYHQVDERVQTTALARALTVTPDAFAQQLDDLAAHRLRAVGVDDYLNAVRLGRTTAHMVIVTFDDGYADQYTRALPILRAHHARATFFITTGNVGKLNHLTWRDIAAMERAGMSFGGHSVEHVDLSKLSARAQALQIDDSLDALATHLHARPRTYAYPSGRFNALTESALTAAKVELAFTTDPAFELHALRRFEIPRIRVVRGMTLAAFDAALATPALRFPLDALPLQPAPQLRPQAATPQPSR